MINLNSTKISFGRQAIANFKVNKETEKVPVTVYKLDEDDYKDTFCFEKTKDISVGNYFREYARPDNGHTSYIIEQEKNGKLLGAAECIQRNGRIYIEMIGTHKNSEYKGLGRALIAGIAKDSKGKFSEIIIHPLIEGVTDFFKKCHFRYLEGFKIFLLDSSKYDKLIRDAKKED